MIKKILNTIRWKNLVFIIIIQYSMRYFIIKPILNNYNLNLLFSDFNFLLLVLTTILIAAAGYLINDYLDFDHDKNLNKNTIITNNNKNKIFNYYIGLNILAIAISFYISIAINFYKLSFIFIIIAGLLWFYSSNYKRSFLIGNIIIALLAALVPLIILPYEILLQYSINKDELISLGKNLNKINFWIIGFSIFAFLTTFFREIIKDIEDFETDNNFNYNTLPIVLGIKNTKIIVISLICITIIAIIYIYFKFINNTFSLFYILLLIILPLIFLIIKTFNAKTSKDYKFLSNLSKLIMFSGVLYSFVAFLNF